MSGTMSVKEADRRQEDQRDDTGFYHLLVAFRDRLERELLAWVELLGRIGNAARSLATDGARGDPIGEQVDRHALEEVDEANFREVRGWCPFIFRFDSRSTKTPV